MQYDPKLKIAMEEIKAVIKKHDVAAFVVLHRPGFSEFLNAIDPTYSCAALENGGVRFHVNSKEMGHEKARQLQEDTYNMAVHFAKQLCQHAVFYMEFEKMLTKVLDGKKFPGRGSSNEQQNN
jgi:hypothetical protein